MSLAACSRMKIVLAMRSNAAASKSAGSASCALAAAALAGDANRAVAIGMTAGGAQRVRARARARCARAGHRIGHRSRVTDAKRRISQRMATKATIASNASITTLANPSPMPRWLNSAASPRPAASPATGPSHERLGAAAAAGVAPAAAGAAALLGVLGLAAGVAGVGGALCAGLSGAVRCMPAGRPPPRRLASTAVDTNATDRLTSTAISQVFIVIPFEVRCAAFLAARCRYCGCDPATSAARPGASRVNMGSRSNKSNSFAGCAAAWLRGTMP